MNLQQGGAGMAQQELTDLYRCEDCGYHGKSRVTGVAAFMTMIGMLIMSAWFLPMIIVALGFMIWIISKPAKRYCPGCKSSNMTPISFAEMDAYIAQNKPDIKSGSEA